MVSANSYNCLSGRLINSLIFLSNSHDFGEKPMVPQLQGMVARDGCVGISASLHWAADRNGSAGFQIPNSRGYEK